MSGLTHCWQGSVSSDRGLYDYLKVRILELKVYVLSADFGLRQLAQSGSRLKSVLLYHIMPGGAFTLDQLASAGNVTTLLGQDSSASYPLQWGKNSTGDVRPHNRSRAPNA